MNRNNHEQETPQTTRQMIEEMEDMSWFIHAQIFDDLLIVSQKQTACFVIKSTEGLILIDSIWPSSKAFKAIVSAIVSVGWGPQAIKKLLLTHGHVDHTGCGKYFVDEFQTKTSDKTKSPRNLERL